MAFTFFRRRQKLVIVIMVALMLAFLLSSVIPTLLQPKPGKAVIGRAGKLKLTGNDLRSVQRHLALLTDHLRLGGLYPPETGEVAFRRFLALNGEGMNRALAWALLVHEARQMGAGATETQARDLLKRRGLSGERLKEEMANLRNSQGGYTEPELVNAVCEYLDVTNAFLAASPASPPSLPSSLQPPPSIHEMRQLCRDLNETVELAVVSFPADDFAADLDAPNKDQIDKYFEAYKRLPPRHEDNDTEFGFGYCQEDHADIAWLLVDYGLLLEAVKVTEDQMLEYWSKNHGRMMIRKMVPALAAGTGTAPATQPASGEYRDVIITDYAEAVPEIQRILKPKVAQAKATELLRQARVLIAEKSQSQDPYTEAVDVMIRPADEVLGKERPGLPAIDATLAEAIEQLETLWTVKIVYPIGTHGKLSLDEDLQVKLSRRTSPTKLGEVLDQIRSQVEYPQIEWVTCEKLPNVIFPAKPADLRPIRPGRSGMIPRSEIGAHEILGNAYADPRGGHSLADILATASIFGEAKSAPVPLIEPGKDYREAMYVVGKQWGRMLWRLMDGRGQHEPETLTDAIEEQIKADIRIEGGFRRAREAADNALKELAGEDLEEFAKDRELNFVKLGPFARKEPQPSIWAEGGVAYCVGQVQAAVQRRQLTRDLLQQWILRAYQLLAQIEQSDPLDPQAGLLTPALALGEGLVDPAVAPQEILQANQKLIEAAFRLVPKEAYSAATDRPAAVVPLPRLRKVLLIQRIGYDIPTEQEFLDLALADSRLKNLLYAHRRQQAMREWFTLKKIITRTGYKEQARPPDGKAKPDKDEDQPTSQPGKT